MLANWKTGNILLITLFVQSVVYVTVFFDVPFARQVIGFIYFTFVPGFIIVKLLELDDLGGLETILFSLGFSIAFLMVVGLLTNEFGSLLGISKPLSLTPLMIILNSLILGGGVLVHLRMRARRMLEQPQVSARQTRRRETVIVRGQPQVRFRDLRTGRFARARKWNKASLSGLLFVFLPILSIIGAMYVNAYGENSILLSMIVAVSLLFVVAATSKTLVPQGLYPLVVFMIAIALLCHSSLISNHLVLFGSDAGGEYFAFKTTQTNAYWNSTNPYAGGEWIAYGRINSMLSVTILPTTYSVLLNMNPILMFKTVFPIIFSFVPLGLYAVWQMHFGKKFALVSAFLFMALGTFFTEMLALNKQIVAELFLVLLLLVVFGRKMKPVRKMICFMIFSFAMIVSHYALAEIFFFLISFTFFSLIVLRRPATNITVSMVVFFFVLMILWYLYTSNSAVFESFVQFGNNVYDQLDDFFNPASRGETVLRGLGLEASPTIWNTISRGFAYATEAFIAIGFVGLTKKRKGLPREYFTLTSVSMALLVALVLVPGLANTLNMNRFYQILLIFLAPLCAVGGKTLVNLISKRRTEIMTSVLLLIVLVPYFLCQTGFVYEVTGSDSWSISLSKYRMNPLRLKGHYGDSDARSVFGAEWLIDNVNVGDSQIYADWFSRNNELRVYGSIYMGYVELISNITKVKPNGTVYLSSLNVHEEIVFDSIRLHNLSSLYFLSHLNRVYSNGGSEIYNNNGQSP